MDFKKVFVVINPASGNDEPILNMLNNVFLEYDIEWDVGVTHELGDGKRYAERAIIDGYDLVMAYGGDGTQLDVATGLIGSAVPLAVLSGGTANALATELSVPKNLASAIAMPFTADARIHSIDLAKANGIYFMVRIGSGLIGIISEHVTRDLKEQYGIGAYFLGGFRALKNPEVMTYTLRIDGEEIVTTGVACLVTNANAVGLMQLNLSPTVSIDDGLLDVFVAQDDIQTVLTFLNTLTPFDPSVVKVQHWQGQSIEIEAQHEQSFYADGETSPITTTPCKIEVVHKALKVIASKKAERLQ